MTLKYFLFQKERFWGDSLTYLMMAAIVFVIVVFFKEVSNCKKELELTV